MPTTTYAEETALLLSALSRVREIAYEDHQPCGLAPFRHVQLPQNVPLVWQPYASMLEDHLEQLANEINAFGHHIRQLSAWCEVMKGYEIEDQLLLMIEFVEAIAIASLGAPYAIRSRLMFSSTKLNHEAALVAKRIAADDSLPPDDKIDYKTMVRVGLAWSSFQAFKEAIDNLSDESHAADTLDFRHRYQHRIPPRVHLGQPGRVTRTKNPANGHTVYSFGTTNPLELGTLTPSLKVRHAALLKAFEAYSSLASEHVRSINEQQHI